MTISIAVKLIALFIIVNVLVAPVIFLASVLGYGTIMLVIFELAALWALYGQYQILIEEHRDQQKYRWRL